MKSNFTGRCKPSGFEAVAPPPFCGEFRPVNEVRHIQKIQIWSTRGKRFVLALVETTRSSIGTENMQVSLRCMRRKIEDEGEGEGRQGGPGGVLLWRVVASRAGVGGAVRHWRMDSFHVHFHPATEDLSPQALFQSFFFHQHLQE